MSLLSGEKVAQILSEEKINGTTVCQLKMTSLEEEKIQQVSRFPYTVAPSQLPWESI